MIDIKHISELAGLKIEPNKERLYKTQLESVINFISDLEEVNTEETKLDIIATNINNHWDEDVISESLSIDNVLFNTNSKHNNLFKVSGILKNKIF